jgi:hypothetical protein
MQLPFEFKIKLSTIEQNKQLELGPFAITKDEQPIPS